MRRSPVEEWLKAGQKPCTQCKKVLPLDQFERVKRVALFNSWCMHCTRAYHREYAQQPLRQAEERWRSGKRRAERREYERKPERKRVAWEKRLKREWGLEPEDLARMYESQDGRCAGCHVILKLDKWTMIDHCHESDRIRGLLCSDCNIALGHLRDNIRTMHRLINYLQPREVRICRA